MTGPAFSAVHLKILSPDGKTVLGELQQIDRAGQQAARNAGRIGANMRQSVNAARQLAFAAGGVTQGLTGAVGAAGQLAEQVSVTSRNAKVAAGATGIGALVTLGLTLGLVWKTSTEQLKAYQQAQDDLASQTKVAQVQGLGPGSELLAKREQVIATGDRELEQIRKMKLEDWQRNELLKARQKLTREQVAAVEREAARSRDRAFGDMNVAAYGNLGDISAQLAASQLGPMGSARVLGGDAARTNRRNSLRELHRAADDHSFTKDQIEAQRQVIEQTFNEEMALLDASLADMAGQVGQSFTASLVDSIGGGIEAAVASGNLGEGFKSMTAGMLAGLGDMMITIGTESLLAAKLMTAIVTALRSFSPEGAIGPAIALIAAGSVLKGLAARVSSKTGGGGAMYSGGSYGGSSGTVIDRGLINPLNPAPNTAGLQAMTPIVFAPTIIGTDDPRAQRELLTMVDKARSRREG